MWHRWDHCSCHGPRSIRCRLCQPRSRPGCTHWLIIIPASKRCTLLRARRATETPTRAFKLRDGETLALPAGTPMRAVVTGSTLRYVLAVIVYDAAQPPTMRMEEGTGPKLIACR